MLGDVLTSNWFATSNGPTLDRLHAPRPYSEPQFIIYRRSHMAQAKRVLRRNPISRPILLFRSRLTPNSLCASLDADRGRDMETSPSTTGIVVIVNGSPVFWGSKRQSLVTLSSDEAEYVALAMCTKDLLWTRRLLSMWPHNNHSQNITN